MPKSSWHTLFKTLMLWFLFLDLVVFFNSFIDPINKEWNASVTIWVWWTTTKYNKVCYTNKFVLISSWSSRITLFPETFKNKGTISKIMNLWSWEQIFLHYMLHCFWNDLNRLIHDEKLQLRLHIQFDQLFARCWTLNHWGLHHQ